MLIDNRFLQILLCEWLQSFASILSCRRDKGGHGGFLIVAAAVMLVLWRLLRRNSWDRGRTTHPLHCTSNAGPLVSPTSNFSSLNAEVDSWVFGSLERETEDFQFSITKCETQLSLSMVRILIDVEC